MADPRSNPAQDYWACAFGPTGGRGDWAASVHDFNFRNAGGSGAPSVSYTYDDPGVANSVGRLTSVAAGVNGTNVASTSSTLAFDSLGRVTSSSQNTAGANYTFPVYVYARSGALTQVTYPSGRVVSYSGFDFLGRPGAVGAGSVSYASGVQYASHGPVSQMTLGNGVTETTAWDGVRLQPVSITAAKGGVSLVSLGYSFCAGGVASCSTNNGNVMRATIAGADLGSNLAQDYWYDGFNRLCTAVESTGGTSNTNCAATPSGASLQWWQAYDYDNYGNRAVRPGSYVPGNFNGPTSVNDFNAQNRWKRGAGDGYDLAGNQTGVASPNAVGSVANAFTWDAENRMASANVAGMGAVTYSYDGDGRRVQKVVGSATTTFVYDAMGELAAEYSNGAGTVAGTTYLTGDMLGSTRLVTDANGAVVRRYDYLPFGEEIAAGLGGRSGGGFGSGVYPSVPDVVSGKFTGKERDPESGLDYFGARYYGSALGRFTSPDWSADPDPIPYADLYDPQTLNLYAYVGNNPMNRRDPNGHWCVLGFGSTCDPCHGNVNTCTTVTAKADPIPSEGPTLFAGVALGHHFADQALVRAKGATDSLAGRFFDLWRTGRLAVQGAHRGFSGPHRLNSAQIRAIIEQIESRSGAMSTWGEGEIKEAVDAIRGAGGDVESFLTDIEKNNPTARTVRDDITSILQSAREALTTVEQTPGVGPAVEAVETACESEPACGLPPL